MNRERKLTGPKLFIKDRCRICGKIISNAGWAYTKHNEMHRRKGESQEKTE